MVKYMLHPPYRRWVVLVFCVAAFLLAGCASEPPADPLTLPACPSTSSQIYTGEYYPEFRSGEVRDAVTKIYDSASSNPSVAKREALKLLSFQTQRWSDVQYITYDPQPRMRVIVTFLTPGIIRTIVLNHFLFNNITKERDKLEAATTASLAILDKREEFAFLILIQPEQVTTPVNFSIFPADILMHTTDGSQIRTTHSDDLLNSMLDTSENLYSGYFFYPAKVTRKGACSYLLTPGIETSLVFKIQTARFAEHDNVTINWVVHFPLLFNLDLPGYAIDLSSPVLNGEDEPEKPLEQLQKIDNYSKETDNILWRDIGRYHWWKMVWQGVPR